MWNRESIYGNRNVLPIQSIIYMNEKKNWVGIFTIIQKNAPKKWSGGSMEAIGRTPAAKIMIAFSTLSANNKVPRTLRLLLSQNDFIALSWFNSSDLSFRLSLSDKSPSWKYLFSTAFSTNGLREKKKCFQKLIIISSAFSLWIFSPQQLQAKLDITFPPIFTL